MSFTIVHDRHYFKQAGLLTWLQRTYAPSRFQWLVAQSSTFTVTGSSGNFTRFPILPIPWAPVF